MTDERRASVAVAYFFALGGTAFGSWASRLADVKERIDASPGPLGAAMFCMAIGSLTSMLLTPRLIRRLGVPTVGGETVFDPTYQDNPLVNVFCLGTLPHERLVLARASGPGNLAVLFGGATGRDGIGGASVLASAGFGEDDVTITVTDNQLVVAGKSKQGDEDTQALYRGIAARSFERRFELAEFIKPVGAQLVNGLLHIDLVREVPEAMKPRTIKIEGPKAQPSLEAKAA